MLEVMIPGLRVLQSTLWLEKTIIEEQIKRDKDNNNETTQLKIWLHAQLEQIAF